MAPKYGKPLSFYKLQALKNDYILIDTACGDFLPPKEIVAALCERKRAVGADGVILLSPCDGADMAFSIFNSDGSEAMMCGNGIRCAALYLSLVRRFGDKISFNTKSGIVKTEILKKNLGRAVVSARIGKGKLIRNLNLNLGDDPLRGMVVDVGNLHACFMCDGDENPDIIALSHKLKTAYADGINVGLMRACGDRLDLTVCERGVGVTDACGTGAAAAALYAARLGLFQGQKYINVHQKGGDLAVSLSENDEITIEGEAAFVYAGSVPFWEEI